MNASIKELSYLGTGRRKKAIARIRLKKGNGKITINNRDLENYCSTEDILRTTIAPLITVEMKNIVDVDILVHGGGVNSQAGAISHGLARALESMNQELRAPLKKAGYLRRDPRMRERKKSGQPGARKRFQFSKR